MLCGEPAAAPGAVEARKVEIRVRGLVQGVGFRPTVWRYARDLGIGGEVLNDSEGVLIRAAGAEARLAAFVDRIAREPPPLARIERIETAPFHGAIAPDFRIVATAQGAPHTQIGPDARLCAACAAEIMDAYARRRRYAFANCTHCGPRFSIVTAIPYDRANTTMARFPLCESCAAEYRDPADRRFHAEATACPACGPRLALTPLSGAEEAAHVAGDAIDAARALLRKGEILAVKGLGGFQLACDASNRETVMRLRRLKRRDAKPFALMARNVAAIERFCAVSPLEREELESARAPILLLRASGPERLPEEIAPGLSTLGFMLPTTPLHLLLIGDDDRPLVMTSGNVSNEPQAIDDGEARARLGAIAAHMLAHDRPIANRVDDSVARAIDGRVRLLRRARGFAPAPIGLPPGFESAPDILAMGGEAKAAFCLVKDAEAVLSPHQGDLDYAEAFRSYAQGLDLYARLFDPAPAAIAVDAHPDYLSSKLGFLEAEKRGAPVLSIQHHHAHIAACLAENGRPLDAPPVLGIALDGLGYGDDGTLWGGEILLADYLGYRRLAGLTPVAMPGGAQAVREPWRNLYAHIARAFGWDAFRKEHARSKVVSDLTQKPLRLLDAAVAKGINAPLASSCGRLFDAVAAALGLCRERQAHEGEAAALLEAAADAAAPDEDALYPFDLSQAARPGLLTLDPSPMWDAVFRDLSAGAPASRIALRFHRGLAQALVETTKRLVATGAGAQAERAPTVALSGGCFQNRILFESVAASLRAEGFAVLTHSRAPMNDGGLSLGQAAIAAARLIRRRREPECVSAFPAASCT